MNMMRRDLPQQSRPASQNAAAKPTASVQRPAGAASVQRPQGAPAPARPGTHSPSARQAQGVPGVRPSVKGDDLFQVIRQLSDLLVKENLALKRHKPDEVKALTERKEQLARLYQSHMNAVHRDPNILKTLDTTKREHMAQAAMRLGELMQENASLLKANIQSINMFFKAVTDALKSRQEEKAAAYSRRGALNGYAVAKRNLAVSFNQTM